MSSRIMAVNILLAGIIDPEFYKPKRKKPKAKSRKMLRTSKPKCTCNRKDLDENEHYIACPVILTPEVLGVLFPSRR